MLATLLAEEETADATRYGNNLALIAIAVDAGFAARAQRLAEYVLSAAPAEEGKPVLMPGDPERRFAEEHTGVRVDRPTWTALVEEARARGISIPRAVEP